MRQARNLRELLIIRQANQEYIESINSNLGTALGLKNADGDPCVIVFVPRKINSKWLSQGTLIKDRLETADGLWCPLDVVEGAKYDIWSEPSFVDANSGAASALGHVPVLTRDEILGPPPLSTSGRLSLLENLRGWTDTILPGSQLYHPGGTGWYGTLGCFAMDKSGTIGVLTNKHVAGEVNDQLIFPEKGGVPLATVSKTFEYLADELRFPGIIDLPENDYRVDCAFAPLHPDRKLDDIDPRIPTLNSSDHLELQPLGDPLPLNLETMGPIGESVIAVGRTRSFQKGKIGAFAYAWDDSRYDFIPDRKYTDYLVIGEDGEQFSDRGDSGKLIVTANGYRPVALLWGGWKEKLRKGRMQEDWTYAIDINKILELLEVTILKEKSILAPAAAPRASRRTSVSGRTRAR